MKKLISCLVVLSLFLFSVTLTYADSNKSEPIPARMEPYTIIEYVSDTEYVILQGGISEDTTLYSNNGIPMPVKGVIVTYSSDGFIQDIEFPEGMVNPLLTLELYSSSPAPLAVVPPDGYYTVQQWGAHNNILFESFEHDWRIGRGRATTFSDTIGQADIKNYKGSVATKLSFDDVPVYTDVEVRTWNSSGILHTENMTKTDAGGMPDAIIDIWKTGVEYWGYTWSSSFSMPSTVTIEHMWSEDY